MDVFLKAAGMDAKSAVIRWGNVDQSIVLSSAVFEPDDERSYRLKPCVRSVWVIGLSFRDMLAMFLIPDTPEARDAAARAGRSGGAKLRADDQLLGMSWARARHDRSGASHGAGRLDDAGSTRGRHREPAGEATSPSVAGARRRRSRCSTRATSATRSNSTIKRSVLSATGSSPHFVVISICGNDFGDRSNPANWVEGQYWLDRIADRCSQRHWEFLLVPGPGRVHAPGASQPARLPGPGRPDLQAWRHSIMSTRWRRLPTHCSAGETTGCAGAFPTMDPFYNTHLMGDQHYLGSGFGSLGPCGGPTAAPGLG